MVGSMAAAAAIFAIAAVVAEMRRRLMAKARIARRLEWGRESAPGHFRFHTPAIMAGMAEDADPA